MKYIRDMMGTTVTIEVVDPDITKGDIDKVFLYFESVENRFSVFKPDSEISLINDGKVEKKHWSNDMKTIFGLAEKTKKETRGFFNIVTTDGKYNPSGIVKGWAIYNASRLLLARGFKNFYIDAGGDIQVHGLNPENKYWSIGIKNPFDQSTDCKSHLPERLWYCDFRDIYKGTAYL